MLPQGSVWKGTYSTGITSERLESKPQGDFPFSRSHGCSSRLQNPSEQTPSAGPAMTIIKPPTWCWSCQFNCRQRPLTESICGSCQCIGAGSQRVVSAGRRPTRCYGVVQSARPTHIYNPGGPSSALVNYRPLSSRQQCLSLSLPLSLSL